MNQSPRETVANEPEREYDQSGCYPADGKAFRVWALLGWLTLVVFVMAGAAALINYIYLS